MGAAIQVVTGRTTNPGATITELTANAGDSFTVKSTEGRGAVNLAQVWAEDKSGGVLRIRSPRLHDAAQGIRIRVPKELIKPLLPMQTEQLLYEQDTLIFELSGGGAETDLATMLLYYADLPGIAANLATWEQIAPRVAQYHGVECNLTSGATVGQYGGGQALSKDFNDLKRGKSYAILGYTTDTPFCTLGITGTDTGNLRVGGPGIADPWVTAGWFVDLSAMLGKPCIPVIQAANVEGVTVDLADSEAEKARNVTIMLAELSG